MEITLKKPLTPRQKRSNQRRQIINAVNRLVNKRFKLTNWFITPFTRMLYIVDLREAHDSITVKVFDGTYQTHLSAVANNKELYGRCSYYGKVVLTPTAEVLFKRETNIKDGLRLYPERHLMTLVIDSKELGVGSGDIRNAFSDYVKQVVPNKSK